MNMNYTELDTADVTRTKVSKSPTLVQRDAGRYKCFCHTAADSPRWILYKRENRGCGVMGEREDRLYLTKRKHPLHLELGQRLKNTKCTKPGQIQSRNTPKLLKEPARSTKSNMCFSNYRYIQPSNKNKCSHTIQVNKRKNLRKKMSFPAIYKYIWPIRLSIKILFTFFIDIQQ